MNDQRLSRPLAVVAIWLAVVADVASLGVLVASDVPSELKIVAVGALALGLCAIVSFYAGQRSRRN
jgi:hypothetical protein